MTSATDISRDLLIFIQHQFRSSPDAFESVARWFYEWKRQHTLCDWQQVINSEGGLIQNLQDSDDRQRRVAAERMLLITWLFSMSRPVWDESLITLPSQAAVDKEQIHKLGAENPLAESYRNTAIMACAILSDVALPEPLQVDERVNQEVVDRGPLRQAMARLGDEGLRRLNAIADELEALGVVRGEIVFIDPEIAPDVDCHDPELRRRFGRMNYQDPGMAAAENAALSAPGIAQDMHRRGLGIGQTARLFGFTDDPQFVIRWAVLVREAVALLQQARGVDYRPVGQSRLDMPSELILDIAMSLAHGELGPVRPQRYTWPRGAFEQRFALPDEPVTVREIQQAERMGHLVQGTYGPNMPYWVQEIDHVAAVVARWLRNLSKSQPQSVLPDRVLETWQLYEKAHAAISEHTPEATDRQVYDLLQEAMSDRKGASRLPAFETFTRYLRQARQAMGLQKNSPRQQISLKRRNRQIMF